MGFQLKVIPGALAIGLMAKIAGAAQAGGGVGDLANAGKAVIDDIVADWPIYLGLPIGVGIAGAIVKGTGFNPGFRLGKFSVKLW